MSMPSDTRSVSSLLKQINAIDAQLADLLQREIDRGDAGPSPLALEMKKGLDCPTLRVLLLYQRMIAR